MFQMKCYLTNSYIYILVAHLCRPPTPRSRATSPIPDSDTEGKKSPQVSKSRTHTFVPDIQEIRVR